MRIDPYLFFTGRCEEAINFYVSELGAELQMMMRYSDSPEPPPPGMVAPGNEHKIMHASLLIGGALLMMSDGDCSGADPTAAFKGFSLSLDCTDEAEARRVFGALAGQGGQVTMRLCPTFWAPLFGMVSDRFGVGWMLGVAAEPES